VATPASSFDIAVLCSGNRFRSPLATSLIRRHAPAGVRVASAAAAPRATGGPLPEALELGPVYGVDLSRHRARPLPERALAAAALVLGFEQHHVDAAVEHGSAPAGNSFTLPELVGLLDEVGEASLRGMPPLQRARRAVELAHAARDRQGRPGELVPELPDPLGSPHVVFVELAATIDRLARRLCAQLFGAAA
jgi:protein-tyrosine-phosphatase